MKIILWITVASAAISACFAERETHRLKVKLYDGDETEEVQHDVVHEKEYNIITDTTAPNNVKGFIPTINFHDYNTNHVVFKDVQRGICLLTHIPNHGSTAKIYNQKTTNYSSIHQATYSKEILSNEEVEAKAGKRIRDFCQDYNTLWIDLTMNVETRFNRDALPLDPEPCWISCHVTTGPCIVSLNTGYQAASADVTFG